MSLRVRTYRLLGSVGLRRLYRGITPRICGIHPPARGPAPQDRCSVPMSGDRHREDSTSGGTDMSVSPVFRSREHGHPRMRETSEHRATRIDLAASGTADVRGSRALAEGQRFTTAGRTITRAAIAFVEEAHS